MELWPEDEGRPWADVIGCYQPLLQLLRLCHAAWDRHINAAAIMIHAR